MDRIRNYLSPIAQSVTDYKIYIAVALLFALVAAFIYYYKYLPNKMSLYRANREQVPGGGGSNGQTSEAELLFFFADWCPHCKAAKPIWESLKSDYEGKNINGYHIKFTEIDCSSETAEVDQMMNKYNVEGYPTIKLLKDGQIIEYDAKPSKDTLVQFLNTVL